MISEKQKWVIVSLLAACLGLGAYCLIVGMLIPEPRTIGWLDAGAWSTVGIALVLGIVVGYMLYHVAILQVVSDLRYPACLMTLAYSLGVGSGLAHQTIKAMADQATIAWYTIIPFYGVLSGLTFTSSTYIGLIIFLLIQTWLSDRREYPRPNSW